MSRLVIRIGPAGNARCLYSELIPLQSLGRLEIGRASSIEFDEKTQLWEVWSEPRKNRRARVLFRHAARQKCLEWEQETLGR